MTRAQASGSGSSAAIRKGKARRPRFGLGRWGNVALLVVLVTLGLPLAHALFGEVAALLGGATILGFLLGRWTAR